MLKSEDYSYCSFDKENSILHHNISMENCYDLESFVFSMSHFTTLVEKNRPKFIIVQILKEPGDYDDYLKDFMKNIVSKIISEAGVRKVAFCFTNSRFVEVYQQREINYPFQVKVFSDVEIAKEWIRN